MEGPKALREKSRDLRMKAPRKKPEMPMWASLSRAVSARKPEESAPRKNA